MKTKRTLTIATVLVALAALLTLGVFRGTRNVHAQDQTPPPVNDRISFGMVGITEGQTARVNVSNVIAQNDSNFPPGPIRVAIVVVNSNGNPFRNRDGNPIRKVVMLERGDSTFLDINFSEFPPGPIRAQLRAVVTVVPPPVGEQPPPVNDRIVTTVEVINNANGRTVCALSAPPSIRQVPPPVND